MAITILKDYSLPFAKNDDYIYIDSDQKTQPQFKYGMRFLFDEQVSLNTVTNTIFSGYIDFNISDIENYKSGDMIYLQSVGVNSVQYNPVPVKVLNIEFISVGVYRFTLDTDKLNKDSYWWLRALKVSPSLSNGLTYNLYKVLTKKVSPNAEGYGVFSVNDIMRNLLDFNPFDSLNKNFKIDFKYLPFEDFFFKQSFESISETSGKISIEAYFDNAELDRLTFGVDDFIVVEFDNPLDSNDSFFQFYTGTQQCSATSFGGTSEWRFLLNKPALYGDFIFSGKIFRADYSPTSFTNSLNLSESKSCYYAGLNDDDISGLSDLELDTLTSSYLVDKKYLSYSPIKQNTFIEDYGFLSFISTNDQQITYNVRDVDGVVHSYQLNLIATEDSILNAPSNPSSINESTMTVTAPRGLPVVRECDDSYSISNSFNSDIYDFNVKQKTKFERVRLLFPDELGSLNGFNFDLNNSQNISVKKSNFTQERRDFSSLNTIKYNNQSRGLVDINTEVIKSMSLNSDFLSQNEGDYFESLITSNNVFAQYRGKIFSVNIRDVKTVLKDKKKGKIRYSLKIEHSNKAMIW